MNINTEEYTHKVEVKKEKQKPKNTDKVVIAFSYNGNGGPSIVSESDDLAFATSVSVNGVDAYYVKMYKIGRNIGKLPNPKDIEFQKGKKKEQIGGINIIQWKSVKKEIFDDYLNYLNTGEAKWLRSAQSRIQS